MMSAMLERRVFCPNTQLEPTYHTSYKQLNNSHYQSFTTSVPYSLNHELIDVNTESSHLTHGPAFFQQQASSHVRPNYPHGLHQTWHQPPAAIQHYDREVSDDDDEAFDLTVASVVQSVFDTEDFSDASYGPHTVDQEASHIDFMLSQSINQASLHASGDDSPVFQDAHCSSTRSSSSTTSSDHSFNPYFSDDLDGFASMKLSNAYLTGYPNKCWNSDSSLARTVHGSMSSSPSTYTPPNVIYDGQQSPNPIAGSLSMAQLAVNEKRILQQLQNHSNIQRIESQHQQYVNQSNCQSRPVFFAPPGLPSHAKRQANADRVHVSQNNQPMSGRGEQYSHTTNSFNPTHQHGLVRALSAVHPSAPVNQSWAELSPVELSRTLPSHMFRDVQQTHSFSTTSRSVPSSPHRSSHVNYAAYQSSRQYTQSAPAVSPVCRPQVVTARLTPLRLKLIEQSNNQSAHLSAVQRKDSVTSVSSSSSSNNQSNNQGESPVTKSRFQTFSTEFWSIANNQLPDSPSHHPTNVVLALQFGLRALLDSNNQSISWRIALELADFCKRRNLLKSARAWLEAAQTINPVNLSISSIWLERAKLDEECGDWGRALDLLLQGLRHCQSLSQVQNATGRQSSNQSNNQSIDSLACKAIKLLDRQGDLETARRVLGSLSRSLDQSVSQPINQISFVWRSLIAGCTLEARLGSLANSRQVIDCLIEKSSWFGPCFVESAQLELKLGARTRSINLLRRGLIALPRFSPLYFAAVQAVREGIIDHPLITSENASSCDIVDESLAPIIDLQHDLLGIALHTNPNPLARIRAVIDLALQHVSRELVWKLQLTRALEEARFECFDEARRALVAAARTAPKGLRFKIFIAGARLELAAFGNDKEKRIPTAGRLLERAAQEQPPKLVSMGTIERSRWLEFSGRVAEARVLLATSMKTNTEWKLAFESVLLELRAGDLQSACDVAERAVNAHPLTGRLWSILVQIYMVLHDFDAAWKTFRRGLSLVPKSGELWCEGSRLVLQPHSPRFSLRRAHRWIDFAIRFTPQYGDTFIEAIKLKLIAAHCVRHSSSSPSHDIDLSRLERLACHSQPNYGAMYQFYRSQLGARSDQSVGHVFRQARRCVEPVIVRQIHIFQAAIARTSNAKQSTHQVVHDSLSPDSLVDLDYLFGAHVYVTLHNLDERAQLEALYAADPITP